MKIDDLAVRSLRPSRDKPITYTDEYYRMTDSGRRALTNSRDKAHVLLSVDLAKTPDFNEGRVPFQPQGQRLRRRLDQGLR